MAGRSLEPEEEEKTWKRPRDGGLAERALVSFIVQRWGRFRKSSSPQRLPSRWKAGRQSSHSASTPRNSPTNSYRAYSSPATSLTLLVTSVSSSPLPVCFRQPVECRVCLGFHPVAREVLNQQLAHRILRSTQHRNFACGRYLDQKEQREKRSVCDHFLLCRPCPVCTVRTQYEKERRKKKRRGVI